METLVEELLLPVLTIWILVGAGFRATDFSAANALSIVLPMRLMNLYRPCRMGGVNWHLFYNKSLPHYDTS